MKHFNSKIPDRKKTHPILIIIYYNSFFYHPEKCRVIHAPSTKRHRWTDIETYLNVQVCRTSPILAPVSQRSRRIAYDIQVLLIMIAVTNKIYDKVYYGKR